MNLREKLNGLLEKLNSKRRSLCIAVVVFPLVFLVASLFYAFLDDSEKSIWDGLKDGLGITIFFSGAASLVVAALDHFASRRATDEPNRDSANGLRMLGGLLAVMAFIVLIGGTLLIIVDEDVEPTGLITGLGRVDDLEGTASILDGTVGDLDDSVHKLDETSEALNETSGALAATTDTLGGVVEDTTEATKALTDRVDDVEASADKAVTAAGDVEAASVEVSAAAASLTSSLGDISSEHAGLHDQLDEIIDRLDGASAAHVSAPASSIGPCERGVEVSVGESCRYPSFGLEFVVSEAGASFLALAGDATQRGYVQADLIVRGEHHTFQAVEESDGRWRIYAAGQWQAIAGRDCAVGATVEPGYYCVWRGNPFRVYATNDLVTDREHAVRFSHGYAHLDLQFYFDGYDDQLISVTDDHEDKQGNPVSRKFIAKRDPESDSRAWIIVCAD